MNDQVLHILLLEDDPAAARLVQELLIAGTLHDFEFTHVDRLGKALELLKTEAVDAMLLDLGLPDSQGIDTLRVVRRRFPHVPVVVLTALDDEHAALEAVRCGAQDYLVKGVHETEGLGQRIHDAVQRFARDGSQGTPSNAQRGADLIPSLRRRLYPARPIAAPGLDLGVAYGGGAFYDVWPDALGGVTVAVGQTGETDPDAELTLLETRAALAALAGSRNTPAALVCGVLPLLQSRLADHHGMRLMVATIAPDRRQLHYVNASSCVGLILDASGDTRATLEPLGPILHATEASVFQKHRGLPLQAGDTLVLAMGLHRWIRDEIDPALDAWRGGGGASAADLAATLHTHFERHASDGGDAAHVVIAIRIADTDSDR